MGQRPTLLCLVNRSGGLATATSLLLKAVFGMIFARRMLWVMLLLLIPTMAQVAGLMVRFQTPYVLRIDDQHYLLLVLLPLGFLGSFLAIWKTSFLALDQINKLSATVRTLGNEAFDKKWAIDIDKIPRWHPLRYLYLLTYVVNSGHFLWLLLSTIAKWFWRDLLNHGFRMFVYLYLTGAVFLTFRWRKGAEVVVEWAYFFLILSMLILLWRCLVNAWRNPINSKIQ